jgi:hypothetical protein
LEVFDSDFMGGTAIDKGFWNLKPGVLALLLAVAISCTDLGETTPSRHISTDAELFHIVTVEQPFSSFSLFPNADSVTSGTLNGSTAHQPVVRVSMNATAFHALSNGRLPAGARFPDGSIIFKQIRQGTEPDLYAVIYKDRGNPLAGNGWLWAEIRPDGTPFISLTLGGSNCTGCHAGELGQLNDFVRTFERQH